MALMIRLEPTEELPRELYIFSGQSNSGGRGLPLTDIPDFQYIEKVKLFTYAGDWIDGIEPMDDKTGATYPVLASDGSTPGVSAGMSFGNSLYTYRPNRTIGIVPASCGGTEISSWQPNASTSSLYGAMIAQAEDALAAAPAGATIKGFIWYQGEAERDAPESESLNWANSFLSIYDGVCSDLGIADLKCIVTELGPNPSSGAPYWDNVQAQQQSLNGARSGNIVCVSAADLTANAGDDLHLNAVSQIALGERYAAAMAGLLA